MYCPRKKIQKFLGPEMTRNVTEPDLSQGQSCPSTLRLNLSNQFKARSVSQLEVSKSLGLEVCHGRRYLSGSSIYIFASVKKVGSAVIRDERWGAHYTILCNLSKPPRILMILYLQILYDFVV